MNVERWKLSRPQGRIVIAVRILIVSTLLSAAAIAERPVIYQLFVRHFGNTNETRKPNGTLAENGVGKFADINAAALDSLRDLGITHVWLTGVLQQATRTDYTAIGQPADDPDICKGRAGSPYAIKDCFDVCPDYALDPARRSGTAIRSQQVRLGNAGPERWLPSYSSQDWAW